MLSLVQTTTRDGLRLDGMFQTAAPPLPGRSFDAVMCVHGTGGNFYSSTLFDALAGRLLSLGIAVLRVNTRGHDLMSNAALVKGGGRRLGAAYEVLDDRRYDLAAWIDWLKQQGGTQVGLIGHSSGALKCLYTQAKEPAAIVQSIVAISPPRLSYSWYSQSERASEFRNTFAQAEALIQAGEPGALLDVKLPLPFVVTAAGYVEKYGPDERYDYLKFIDRVRCPVLVTLGEIEVGNNVAFRDAGAEINRVAPHVRVETIAGADHFYSGVREVLLDTVERWLAPRG